MADSTCPLCNTPIESNARNCNSCGVDLALAASLSESAIITTEALREIPIHVAPEVLVPRLGQSFVEQGLLREDQLQQALAYQKEQSNRGAPVLLGRALVELEMIDANTLDRVITQQIFQLQDALRQANRELEQRVQERTHDLQQALSRLTELNQLKTNFIANISHELRTPLTHIKGYTELISEKSLGPVTEEQVSALEVMERSIRRLEGLINDLIRFSNTSAGDIALRVTPFSAQFLVERSLAQIDPKIASGPVRIDAVVEDDLPDLLGDLSKITWVILHLIDNAVKFSPAGGRVRVSAIRRGDEVRLAVEDSGIGIPEDKFEEIFEPFHQLDATSTRRFGGTGLGLALVRRIIEAHQTEIHVESELGSGSRFWFCLPIADSQLE